MSSGFTGCLTVKQATALILDWCPSRPARKTHPPESMPWNHAFALLGGVLLAGVGGELFVRGIVGIARWLRVSPGIIGATVAAFATSSPEISVAVSSAMDGHPEISLGDVVGSNVVNVALILGIALVFSRIHCDRGTIRREFPGALLVPVILGLLGADRVLGRIDGLVLLAVFTGWIWSVILEVRRQRDATAEVIGQPVPLLAGASCIGGLMCLFAGGRLIVIGAEGVAQAFGIPEFVIGATVVALGTSVPELATVLISQLRGHREVGLGVILGSNIFNGLFVTALAAIIRPIQLSGAVVPVSLAVMFLAVAATYPGHEGSIGRKRGVILLLIYASYLVFMLRI